MFTLSSDKDQVTKIKKESVAFTFMFAQLNELSTRNILVILRSSPSI